MFIICPKKIIKKIAWGENQHYWAKTGNKAESHYTGCLPIQSLFIRQEYTVTYQLSFFYSYVMKRRGFPIKTVYTTIFKAHKTSQLHWRLLSKDNRNSNQKILTNLQRKKKNTLKLLQGFSYPEKQSEMWLWFYYMNKLMKGQDEIIAFNVGISCSCTKFFSMEVLDNAQFMPIVIKLKNWNNSLL